MARQDQADPQPALRYKRGRPRGTGTQTVYEALRDRILKLALPPGAHIDEAQVEAEFKVSRTPIREALIRLQADGLVKFAPNRGHYVTTIDFTELPRAFECLDLIQAAVLKLAALRRSRSDLDRMQAENEAYHAAALAGDHTAMTEANHRFHLVIGEASGNRFLCDAYEAVLNFNLRTTRLVFDASDRIEPGQQTYFERIYSEHAEMIALIRDQKAALLGELSRRHVELFHGRIARFVASGEYMDAEVTAYPFEMGVPG